ncbi:MAG: RHS repeat protein [Nitrospinota bacterium]|nr:RHS repeat protein [Nitrospinota bacterium]
MTTTLPSGLTTTTTQTRSVTLADSADPLSVTATSDTTSMNERIYRTGYNAAARQITTTSPTGKQSYRWLDEKGRTVKSRTPGLADVTYTYDSLGRVASVDMGGRTTQYSYDAQGQIASVTDALGRSVGYAYDGAGRMIRQYMPDGRVVSLNYDSNGNMTAITPPSRPAHAFAYSKVNQETEYDPPDIGLPVDVTRYEYNLDRELTRVIRPDGLTIGYNYDSAGRLASIVDPSGRIDYTYGSNGCTSCGGNDLPQTVTRTDSANGATESMSFAYDGSMTTGVTFSGTVGGSIAWTFDNNFWVTSQSVNGSAINFTYDNDGRLTAVGDLTITRNWQNGFLTGTALGTITDNYAFNTFGETASYNAKGASPGAASLFDVQYTRDAIGRIATKTETTGGTTTIYEYSYDVAGRLVAVKEGGVVVSTYDYDANGNRITAVTSTGTYQGFYDLQDRMTKYGDASYTYTANGELLTKVEPAGTTSYNYDVYGNLRGVTTPGGTTIEYIIDASNRRIGKKVNGALVQGFIYKDQLEPVAELDGAGNIVARFVYASKGHVPDYMIKGGVTYRVISDHLGSVRLVVNATDGSIAQKLDYDEFGNVITDTNPGFQPFAFAGGIYDSHTKLTRFGARDYDAFTGRWTSKDPIRFDGDGQNLYVYVMNDIVNWVDTSGLKLTPCICDDYLCEVWCFSHPLYLEIVCSRIIYNCGKSYGEPPGFYYWEPSSRGWYWVGKYSCSEWDRINPNIPFHGRGHYA